MSESLVRSRKTPLHDGNFFGARWGIWEDKVDAEVVSALFFLVFRVVGIDEMPEAGSEVSSKWDVKPETFWFNISVASSGLSLCGVKGSFASSIILFSSLISFSWGNVDSNKVP